MFLSCALPFRILQQQKRKHRDKNPGENKRASSPKTRAATASSFSQLKTGALQMAVGSGYNYLKRASSGI